MKQQYVNLTLPVKEWNDIVNLYKPEGHENTRCKSDQSIEFAPNLWVHYDQSIYLYFIYID